MICRNLCKHPKNELVQVAKFNPCKIDQTNNVITSRATTPKILLDNKLASFQYSAINVSEQHLQSCYKLHTLDGKAPCNIPDGRLHWPELRTDQSRTRNQSHNDNYSFIIRYSNLPKLCYLGQKRLDDRIFGKAQSVVKQQQF